MKNGLIRTVFYVATGVVICWAQTDFITLKNGQTAKTTVKDTVGCQVTIIRGGNAVKIEKSKIRYVRWGKDSISYEAYACPEAPKKAVRFEDTPSGKILSFLDTCPELSQVVKTGAKIGYVQGAITGSMNRTQDSLLREMVVPILSNKNAVVFLTADSLAAWLTGTSTACTYAFVVKKCGVERNNEQTIGKNMFSTVKKEEMFLVVEFVLIDLGRKEIVFHFNTASKRSMYNSEGPASVETYLPGEVKQKFEDNRTNEAMASSMESSAHKLGRALKQHLDIKD